MRRDKGSVIKIYGVCKNFMETHLIDVGIFQSERKRPADLLTGW